MPFHMPPRPAPDHRHRSLGDSINAATRNVHTKLNRLIIARLPLALPPHTTDASLYASGLLHIAPIYITFESLWRQIISPSHGPDLSADGHGPVPSNVGPGSGANGPRVTTETTAEILHDLYFPGLMRSDRLRSDIRAITGWSPQTVNEQLKAVSRDGRLHEFIRHIRRAIEKRPHVLISYAYILFMALFAGGRFLRASLEAVADQDNFWAKAPSPVRPNDLSCRRSPQFPPSTPPDQLDVSDAFLTDDDAKHTTHVTNPDGTALPLSFFHFAAPGDGEELKREFKRRLAAAEEKLGARERHDIVQESICIFENMLLLIAQLDSVCETDLDANADVDPIMASSAAFGSRLRDSVVVAKERRAIAQSQSMGSETSEAEDHANHPPNRYVHHHNRHNCTRSDTQHSRGASDDSLAHDWHSTHASSPSGHDSEEQSDCCALLGKSVRFESKSASEAKQTKRRTFFSLDGPASRRESSESPDLAEKNSQHDILAPTAGTARTILSNIVLFASVAALVGVMYFTRNGGEETPA